MTKFKGKYRVESNRWQYWDYSATGRYFLTDCIVNRECIFGSIKNGEMILSEFGQIVKNEILKMPGYNKRVILDEWVIMPNHIHLLIELGDEGFDNGVVVNDGDNDVYGDDDAVDKIHEFYTSSDKIRAFYTEPDKIHEFYLQPPPTTDIIPPTNPPPPNVPIVNPWWHNHDHKPTQEEIKQYRKQRRKMIIPMVSGKMKMISSKQINIIRNTPGRKNWQHDYYEHVIRNNKEYQRIKQYIINNPKNWDEDKFNGENPDK